MRIGVEIKRNYATVIGCKSRINATLYGQPDSPTFGSAVDFWKIDTKGFNLSKEGAFVHTEFTGGCEAVVFITFKRIQYHLGFN